MRIFTMLFIIGLLVETAAFFVGQTEYIPFMIKIVSPKYFRAKEGIKRLESSQVLEPTNIGFGELQEVFKELLREQNPAENIANISALRFDRGGARLAFSQKRAREVIPINVTLSNGQNPQWNLEDLTNRIEVFKNKNIFLISLIIFGIGIVIQIAGFIIDKAVRPSG